MLGLGFRHVPIIKSEVFSDRVVEGVSQVLAELEGPVLAHCASGVRSAIAWAAAAARTQPADCVIAALKNAGYDLAALRDELEDQRGRAARPQQRPRRWIATARSKAKSSLRKPLQRVCKAVVRACCACRRRTARSSVLLHPHKLKVP